jgi:hypothetical protein
VCLEWAVTNFSRGQEIVAEMVEAVNKKKEEKTEEKESSNKTNIESDLVEVFA